MAQGLYQIYKNLALGLGFYKSDINRVPRVITIIYPTYNTDMGMRNCLAHCVIAMAEEMAVSLSQFPGSESYLFP